MIKQIQVRLVSTKALLIIVLTVLVSLAVVFTIQIGISTAAGTSSTKFAGTAAEDTSVGSVSWSNYSNATASDDSRVTVESVGSYTTYYIKATNFGFNIPSGATIDGIVVEWEKQVGNGGINNTKDNSVRLVKGGTISGDDKASASTWPANGSETFVSYGGSADKWGLTWTASDINSTTFGAVLAAESTDGGTKNFEVDSVKITVHYTEGTVLKALKSPSTSTTTETTLYADEDLRLISLDANNKYIISGFLFASTTSNTPDLKIAFAIPAGAVLDLGYTATQGTNLKNAEFLEGTGVTDVTSGTIALPINTPVFIQIFGTLQMGSTVGDFVLKWAQATSDSAAVTIIEGSYLQAENTGL